MRRCVVFLPGAPPDFEPEADDILICADSGYTAARSHGLVPDILVGDMDSISGQELAEARGHGVEVHIHPRDKDMTDGEMALEMAVSRSPDRIMILGGLEGRTDHVIATFLLLEKAPKGLETELWVGTSRITLLRGVERKRFDADRPIVSLVPLSAVKGVRTDGLRWPLEGEGLSFGSTRGVHNEPVSAYFEVSLEEGSLLVIRSPSDEGQGKR